MRDTGLFDLLAYRYQFSQYQKITVLGQTHSKPAIKSGRSSDWGNQIEHTVVRVACINISY